METRREFLLRTTAGLLVIPVASVLEACGYESGATTCQGTLASSSVVLGHAHTVCVLAADLGSPPAGGRTYSTSSSGGHMHTVTLTQSELQRIAAGQVVMVTSSGDAGHSHTFAIQKAANGMPGDGGMMGGPGGGGYYGS
jgi:hypothetical protein